MANMRKVILQQINKYKKMSNILDTITGVVARTHGLKKNEVFTKYRGGTLVEARRQIMYIAKQEYGITCKKIGDWLNLDHSSVVHHCKKHSDLYEVDKNYRDKFDKAHHLMTALMTRPSDVKNIYDVINEQDDKIMSLELELKDIRSKFKKIQNNINQLNIEVNG